MLVTLDQENRIVLSRGEGWRNNESNSWKLNNSKINLSISIKFIGGIVHECELVYRYTVAVVFLR